MCDTPSILRRMEFRAEQDTLAGVLTIAQRATAGTSSSRLALTGLHLTVEGNTLTAVGTDLDRRLTVEAEVQGITDGQALIPARLLCDVVKALPDGAIEVSVGEDSALVRAGAAEFSLRVQNVEDFPQSQEPDDLESPVTIPSADLTEALEQVVMVASSDDSRPILTGILLEGVDQDGQLLLVSTDSYRLARRVFDGADLGEDKKVLLPAKAADDLLRLLNPKDEDETVEMQLAKHHAIFRVGTTTLMTRLIPGDFPNYRGLIPEGKLPTRVTLDKSLMLAAVNRVRVLAQDSTPLRLKITENEMQLKALTQDVGQAEETIPHEGIEGPNIEAAFNPSYFRDGLEAIHEDRVILSLTDNVKPVTLTGAEEASTYLYLLMPVRVA